MPSTTSRQVSVAKLAQALGSLIQLKSSILRCSLRIGLTEAESEQESAKRRNGDANPPRPLAVSLLWARLRHLMKSYRKELWFETKKRREFIRITPQINQCLRESGIAEGLVLVNAMHITASVFINDNESGLHHDFDAWLEKLAPEKPYDQYAHNGAEDNADAHLKRTLMGREVVVAVTEGRLDFGPWEEIFYGEFDGKRRKRVLVKVIGE
jgi:secondary thiamine-phosphate synthase enzyme